jgi:hypothetical protein
MPTSNPSPQSGRSRPLVSGYLAAVALGLGLFALTRALSPWTAPDNEKANAAADGPRVVRTGKRAEHALATTSPPALVTGAGQRPAIQNIPGAPGYDPVKFLGLISLARVFEAEPRLQSWAAAVENWIQPQLLRDLAAIAPEVRPTVTCKTTVCRWSWSGPPEVEEKVRWLQRTLFLGAITERTGRNEIIVAYHGGEAGFKALSLGDGPATIEVIKRQREKILRSIHEGRRAFLDQHVPRNAWPKE